MDKREFISKWALRIAIAGSLIYTLIKGDWVGTASGAIVLIATFMVDYINEKFIKINPTIISMIYTFCILSVVMGSMWRLYDIFGWWDLFLHTISGIMLGIIGNDILNRCTGETKVKPLVRFLFILGVVCIGGMIWEIYEFTVDTWLGLNTQLAVTTGVADTMGDLITDFLGGIISGGFFALFSGKK